MTWLFLYLFPLLVVESLGEHWRLIMRVVLVGYWFMYCGCPWYYMDSLLWDVVSGLAIYFILCFVVGASWYICDRYSFETCNFRLQIGYVDDVKFTWYTFGGMHSWMGLTLVVGAISAMDILTTTDTCDYLWIRFLCLEF